MNKKFLSHLKYNIEIYHSILGDDVSKKWNGFESPFLTGGYLGLIEIAQPSDLSFQYGIVYDENKNLCAIIYFQLLNFTGKNINFSQSLLLSKLIKSFLFFRPLKLFMCGNLFAVNFPPYCFKSELISAVDLIQIMNKVSELEKVDAIMFKDVQEKNADEVLLKLKFQKYSADLTMSILLKPEWLSFKDYINDLSKKYRKRAEKIITSSESIIRKEFSFDDIQMNRKIIFKLFQNVSEKQNIKLGLIGSNYFEEFKKKYPKDFQLVAYFHEEEMIAFATYIDRGIQLESHYIGINYDYNHSYNLYFNILFDSLKLAIEKKKNELELGRTAREAKANLGGKPVYFNDYYRLKSKLALWAMNWFGKNFQQSMGFEWEKRNPFK